MVRCYLLVCVLSCLAPQVRAKPVSILIDLQTSPSRAEGQGSGFLHSLTGTEPPDNFVDPLKIKLWRGACMLDESLYQRLQRSGATIQYVLSDGFQHPAERGDCTAQRDTKLWPHTDPELWRRYVEAEARKVIAQGWKVVWEPWNEPDFWPGIRNRRTREIAFQQYLDAFLVAYRTIKALDPEARFSGPSLSAYDGFGWNESRRQIEAFLAFCARNNLEVSDLSWHGFDDRRMHEYPQRIREMRRLAAERFPGVKVQRVIISEIVSEAYFTSPGDLVATLKYLDDGGVDLVGRACWDGCWWPTLDGSAGKDRTGAFLPTPLWWVNMWYASLRGDRYEGQSSMPGIAASGVAQEASFAVLLGFSKAAGPANQQEVVIMLKHAENISVPSLRVERLLDLQDSFLKAPIVVQNFKAETKGGTVFVRLPEVFPKDAYLMTFDANAR